MNDDTERPIILTGQVWKGERAFRTLYVFIDDANYGENVSIYTCEEDGAPKYVTNHHGTFIRRRVVSRDKFGSSSTENGFVLHREPMGKGVVR